MKIMVKIKEGLNECRVNIRYLSSGLVHNTNLHRVIQERKVAVCYKRSLDYRVITCIKSVFGLGRSTNYKRMGG